MSRLRAVPLLSFLALTLVGARARAEPPSLTAGGERSGQRPVGFSNLVLRVDTNDEIGIAGEDFRVHILETLRGQGFNAVGAESLVFAKDASQRAELLLGGTIRELECLDARGSINCRIGIEWQVLDLSRDTIVYSVFTRSREMGGRRDRIKGFGRNLVLGALRSLMARPRFVDVLRAAPNPVSASPSYAKASSKACPVGTLAMPAGAEEALRATVLVKSHDGFGSGFFLSPDGLVVTAAHVANSPDLSIRMRDGTVHQVIPIRIARQVDTALLRVVDLGASTTPCLPVNLEPKAVGTEVYAIGSPASEKLAFSLTRGIISGLRTFDGTQFLQTDASISPGNSGGPLIDARGRATAIASWKVAGAKVEGVAFGIPVEEGLAALAVTPGVETDPTLAQAKPVEFGSDFRQKTVEPDLPDSRPWLDPEAELAAEKKRQRAVYEEAERRERTARDERERQRSEMRKRLTPSYVPILRYGGLALAAAGGMVAYYSYSQYDDYRTTHAQFQSLTLMNDLGWAAAGLGAASFAVSFILMPPLPKEAKGAKPRLAIEGTPAAPRLSLRLDL